MKLWTSEKWQLLSLNRREWFKYEFKTTLVTEWQNNYWTLLARKMICQCSRWSIDLVKIDKPWYFAQPPPIVNYFSSHRIGCCWNNSIYCPIHTSVHIFMCMDWDIHHVFHGVPYITRQCGASLQADWTLWPIPWPLFHFGSPLPSSSTMSLPINDEGNVEVLMFPASTWIWQDLDHNWHQAITVRVDRLITLRTQNYEFRLIQIVFRIILKMHADHANLLQLCKKMNSIICLLIIIYLFSCILVLAFLDNCLFQFFKNMLFSWCCTLFVVLNVLLHQLNQLICFNQ